MEAETSSGRIELSGICGDVHSTTQSGSIRLRNITGAVIARNQSGSIESFGSGGSVTAQTVSGSIRIAQSSAAPIHAVSRSGAIRVELAGGKGYNLNVHSDKGKISTSSEIASPGTKDQHTLSTQISGGGPAVNLETQSSKIEIQ